MTATIHVDILGYRVATIRIGLDWPDDDSDGDRPKHRVVKRFSRMWTGAMTS